MVNSLPNNELDDIILCCYYRVKNIVGKGENAGYEHFLLFPQCFQRLSLSGSLGLPAFSPFPTMFSKPVCCCQNEYLWSKWLTL